MSWAIFRFSTDTAITQKFDNYDEEMRSKTLKEFSFTEETNQQSGLQEIQETPKATGTMKRVDKKPFKKN